MRSPPMKPVGMEHAVAVRSRPLSYRPWPSVLRQYEIVHSNAWKRHKKGGPEGPPAAMMSETDTQCAAMAILKRYGTGAMLRSVDDRFSGFRAVPPGYGCIWPRPLDQSPIVAQLASSNGSESCSGACGVSRAGKRRGRRFMRTIQSWLMVIGVVVLAWAAWPLLSRTNTA